MKIEITKEDNITVFEIDLIIDLLQIEIKKFEESVSGRYKCSLRDLIDIKEKFELASRQVR